MQRLRAEAELNLTSPSYPSEAPQRETPIKHADYHNMMKFRGDALISGANCEQPHHRGAGRFTPAEPFVSAPRPGNKVELLDPPRTRRW